MAKQSGYLRGKNNYIIYVAQEGALNPNVEYRIRNGLFKYFGEANLRAIPTCRKPYLSNPGVDERLFMLSLLSNQLEKWEIQKFEKRFSTKKRRVLKIISLEQLVLS